MPEYYGGSSGDDSSQWEPTQLSQRPVTPPRLDKGTPPLPMPITPPPVSGSLPPLPPPSSAALPPVPAYGAPSVQPYGAPYYGQPAYGPPVVIAPVRRTNAMAITALVVSLAGCGCLSWLGIVFGLIARNQIKNSNGTEEGDGLAIAGIIIGAIALVGILAYFVINVIYLGLVVGASSTSTDY
ncbi:MULTISPECIES: DUF4190 domain-containing protein [unclassified Gordonia (in: high G+C Gram-positive bacteria)]|uniref:DUF4190 domain-containing protein n=1 Tax=Gordonia sp. B7-2 TaxID=3420932 RepID=UPI003D8A0AD2